jgi:hypothetical protein
MKVRVFLLASALLALVVVPVAGQDKLGQTPFLPLDIGSQWDYKVGDQKVSIRVVKHETVEIAAKKDEKQKITAARLEVTGGDRKLNELVTVLGDGIYRFSAAGKELNPPLCFLKLPPKPGEKWTYEAMLDGMLLKGEFVTGTATVGVPAGKFQTVTSSCKEFQIGTQKVQLEYWFAPNIGIVKQKVHVGNHDIVLELEKFERGKGQ